MKNFNVKRVSLLRSRRSSDALKLYFSLSVFSYYGRATFNQDLVGRLVGVDNFPCASYVERGVVLPWWWVKTLLKEATALVTWKGCRW
jgi:hypothetical protein